MSSFSFKVSSKPAKKSNRKIRNKQVGGGNLGLPVSWVAFYAEDLHAPIPQGKAWQPARNYDTIGDYYWNWLVGWPVPLMVQFMARRGFGLNLVWDFTAEEANIDQEIFQHPNPELINAITYDSLGGPYIFLITFVARNGYEAVGVITIQNDIVEVFIPFPLAWGEEGSLMRIVTESVYNTIVKGWMQRKPRRIQLFKFPCLDMPTTNAWVIYYLFLRSSMNFNNIQTVFRDCRNIFELARKAVITTQQIGRLMSDCIEQNQPELYTRLFSPNARAPVTLSQTSYEQLLNVFDGCTISFDQLKLMQNEANIITQATSVSTWPTNIPEHWNRFIEVPNASQPKWNFTRKKQNPIIITEPIKEILEIDEVDNEDIDVSSLGSF